MKQTLIVSVSTLAAGLGLALSVQARPYGHNGVFGSSPDWSAAKSEIGFVFIKASQGAGSSGWQNSGFQSKMHGAQAAGLYAGCYHRCEPKDNMPITEAQYFWNTAQAEYVADVGNNHLLSPALDVEDELSGNASSKIYMGGAGQDSYTLSGWCNKWFSYVQSYAAADGITLEQVVYINAGAACYLESTIGGWSWVANPYNGEDAQTGSPWDPCGNYCTPWGGCGHWRVWQYKWAQACDYSNCQVDYNVANESDAGALYSDIGAH